MKRTIITALALSGALALGACGSTDSGTGTTAGTSQEAPAAASAKVGDTVDLADIATKSAAAVKEKGTAYVAMELGPDGVMEGGVDFSGASPKMSMTTESEGQTMQVVYLDKVMYMGGDSFKEVTGGKKWIKISADGDDLMSKTMGPMLGQMESAVGNPAEALKAYKGAKATVTKVQDGVTTYSVKLTKEQLAAGVKAQGAGIPGLTEKALEQLPDGVTYELALGDDLLPRSVQTDLGNGEKMTMMYARWGEPVDVKAPAASEVGTFQMPTG